MVLDVYNIRHASLGFRRLNIRIRKIFAQKLLSRPTIAEEMRPKLTAKSCWTTLRC